MDQQSLAPVVSALADGRRRRICRYMAERSDSTVTLDELAGALATPPRGGRPPPGGRPGSRDRVKIELHHVHLPKLDDARVVEYYSERRTVETGAVFRVATEMARTTSDGGERSGDGWSGDG